MPRNNVQDCLKTKPHVDVRTPHFGLDKSWNEHLHKLLLALIVGFSVHILCAIFCIKTNCICIFISFLHLHRVELTLYTRPHPALRVASPGSSPFSWLAFP